MVSSTYAIPKTFGFEAATHSPGYEEYMEIANEQ
jgi:hypothetical protein